VGEAVDAKATGAKPRVRLRRQINPRKTKENQTKKLGVPWIPLAELGLINGLRRIQVKKLFPVTPCLRNRDGTSRLLRFAKAREFDPANVSYNTNSDYRKEVVLVSVSIPHDARRL
jgi:hypothetical protein